jgi:adenylate cyclase
MKSSLLQQYKLSKLLHLNLSFFLFMQLQGLLVEGFSLVALLNISVNCLLIGTAVTLFEIYLSPLLAEKLSVPVNILVKTGIYLLIVLGGMLLLANLLPPLYRYSGLFSEHLHLHVLGIDRLQGIELIKSNLPLFTRVIGINLLGCFLIAYFNQVSSFLGEGIWLKYLKGMYRKPLEEERIFMFLDIESSTTLAEKLGNLRYSNLLRDFFSDLSEPVLETHGEIYQFVGDEAIITWPMARGIQQAGCLRCFYRIEETILERQTYYLHTYGIVPRFKAGLHGGKVVANRVGELKSEMVYHGDVLNTASRIQEQCNRYGYRILLSDTLAALLSVSGNFLFQSLGNIQLRGKEIVVGLVTVASIRTSIPAAVS